MSTITYANQFYGPQAPQAPPVMGHSMSPIYQGPPHQLDVSAVHVMFMEYQYRVRTLEEENQRLHHELEELRQQQTFVLPPKSQTRYWTKEEHEKFLQALDMYGSKDVKSISAFVKTRTPTQVRTHAQKYFLRLKREAKAKAQEVDAASVDSVKRAPLDEPVKRTRTEEPSYSLSYDTSTSDQVSSPSASEEMFPNVGLFDLGSM